MDHRFATHFVVSLFSLLIGISDHDFQVLKIYKKSCYLQIQLEYHQNNQEANKFTLENILPN